MKKVVVAMSGGIDSSVAAFLLKKSGYDVVGITLRLFSDKNVSCCGSVKSIDVFKKVSCHLGIRYYVKNAVDLFNRTVIEKFVSDYKNGFTPNPCVECNRFLKFDYLLKIAKSIGADKIATGHYAIIEKDEDEYVLKRGKDSNKDQSYFLYSIKREFIKDIIFPLGYLKKEEVKKIALENNIPVDLNHESRDICFTGGKNYSLWLKQNGYVEDIPGYFRYKDGKICGIHNGYYKYTIGQRKKLGITAGSRVYVVSIDPSKNEVILGDINDVYHFEVEVDSLNWLSRDLPSSKDVIYAQVRYRHNPQEGRIFYLSKSSLRFAFNERQFALTPGQSIVFYKQDRVIGGGIIRKVLN